MEDIVVTKVTARPMLIAGLVSLETPINEQRPKNFDKIKLFMNTMLIKIIINLLKSILPHPKLIPLLVFKREWRDELTQIHDSLIS
jgi:hypothetical protein